MDDILPNARNCPNLVEAYEAVMVAPQMTAFKAREQELVTSISKKLNFTISSVGDIWDCMNTHICHEFPFPEQITESDFNQMSNMVRVLFVGCMIVDSCCCCCSDSSVALCRVVTCGTFFLSDVVLRVLCDGLQQLSCCTPWYGTAGRRDVWQHEGCTLVACASRVHALRRRL